MPEEVIEAQEQVEAPATDEGGTPASAVAEASAPVDTKALHATIGSLLGKAFHEEAPAEEAVVEEEQTPAEEDGGTEEEQDAQEAAATPTPVAVNPPAAGTAPTLPAAHRRSLIARGYTDQEIDADLKNVGSKFLEMAERVHRGRSAEIADWATAGRQAKATAQQQQPVTPQQQVPASGLQPLDAAKLKEQFGDDKLIDALVGPVNAAIAKLNTALPVVQSVQQRSQQAETEALVRHVDGFFGSKDLEPFKQIYGDNANFATDQTKIAARNKVLEMADALITGAGYQGRSLTLGEAMTMAHDSLSSDYKIQAARTQIKQQLQQRNKGISMKPQGRANNAAGLNGTRKSVENTVGALLQKAFA